MTKLLEVMERDNGFRVSEMDLNNLIKNSHGNGYDFLRKHLQTIDKEDK